jgi:hypothetical protein
MVDRLADAMARNSLSKEQHYKEVQVRKTKWLVEQAELSFETRLKVEEKEEEAKERRNQQKKEQRKKLEGRALLNAQKTKDAQFRRALVSADEQLWKLGLDPKIMNSRPVRSLSGGIPAIDVSLRLTPSDSNTLFGKYTLEEAAEEFASYPEAAAAAVAGAFPHGSNAAKKAAQLRSRLQSGEDWTKPTQAELDATAKRKKSKARVKEQQVRSERARKRVVEATQKRGEDIMQRSWAKQPAAVKVKVDHKMAIARKLLKKRQRNEAVKQRHEKIVHQNVAKSMTSCHFSPQLNQFLAFDPMPSKKVELPDRKGETNARVQKVAHRREGKQSEKKEQQKELSRSTTHRIEAADATREDLQRQRREVLAQGSSLLGWRQTKARRFKMDRIALANEAFAEQYQNEIPGSLPFNLKRAHHTRPLTFSSLPRQQCASNLQRVIVLQQHWEQRRRRATHMRQWLVQIWRLSSSRPRQRLLAEALPLSPGGGSGTWGGATDLLTPPEFE